MERHFFMISRALNARKRKIFALFFALAASIGLSWAQNPSGECGADLTWEFEAATGKLTISGTGTMLDNPSWTNEGLNSRITSVSLPEGLTDIRDYVFANCEYLESITLPSGLTSIESSAFMNCRALKEITLPGSLTTLGERTFYNCEQLESIKLPEGITTLRNDVFAHCNHLQSVTLPSTLTTLGDDVFRHCSRLESITLPDGLTSIGNNAFSGCDRLESITLPEGVTSIGSSAFEHCGFESITLPEGITTLEYGVFSNCDRLQSVTLPPSLTSIGEWAFSGCWNLASVALPAGVTTIGESAFGYCTSLTEFTNNAATPQTINANVFEDVTLSNITLNVPGTSKAAYEAADVWKDFGTKASIPGTEPAPARDPQRFTDTVKIEDLVVGDTLAMGAKMNSDQYFLFYCAPNRARRHGNLWTSDFESFFLGSADAISKHGAIDLENPDGLRGCLEPVNENGELGEEWIVTSTNPFTIAGIGKAEITNHSYNSDVDYAALEPGDTITFGATILNTPEKVWFLANRMQRIFSSGEISIIDDDRWSNSYGTIGKNGVLKADNYGTTQVPINEQGTLGGKWVVVFYSPLTIAGIGYPMPTLTLSDKVSIVGMPVAGITDLGNNNYEIEQGTQFQIQAAVPEHYSFIGWSDLASTDPNYTANPRTITINSDLTIKPMYALEAFTITLTSNDTTMGKVTLRAGAGGGEDGDMSIANNADLEGANTSRNIAVGADGSIHVVYKSTEDQSVKYIKSIDGVTFTEPVTVANGARECEVAVSSNGKVYVSYYVENDGGYIAYSADGTNFTNVKVDDNALSIHLATDGDYVYAVNKSGTNFYYSSDGGQTYNMHSGWSGYMFSDVMVDPLNHNVLVIKDEPNVVVRYSTDHGATFTEEAPVMVQGGNDQLAIFFSTATMGDGKVYMAGSDAFVAIIDYKTATCTKTDVNSTDNRSLCADPVGNVIVGVEQGGNLYYQLSTNSAVSFGDKVLVSNGSGANAALNYHDGTLLYLFTKDNKLYLATRTGIVPTESVVDNGDGTYAVQYGTEVTFTAKAKPGYHVESWSNAVEVNDIIVATQTLEVNSAMTIGATFAANPILTIATNDSTKGIVSLGGAGGGEPIAEVTITQDDFPTGGNSCTKDGVTVSAGWIDGTSYDIYGEGSFSTTLGNFTKIEVYAGEVSSPLGEGWSGNNERQTWTGNASSVSFSGDILSAGEEVNLMFTIGDAAPATEGIIDLGGGQYSVVPGTELTFVAKPAEEHYLVSWNDEPATSDTLKLTMNGELAVNATFAHVPYIYTLPEGVSIVEPMPAGITAKGNGVYEIAEGTTFQISADIIPEHYHFDHWADLADSVAMYAANPRTIVAGENMTIEPIFAIDTYTLTLATNDSTKGVVSVIGAGSGAGAGVGEMISLSEKQTENPVMGEYFQVAGEGVNYEGRIIGRSDDYQLTISSQNGEKLDFIILKVSSKGLWSGYTVSSTAGDVEDLLDNFTIRVSNINATSVTISRSGTTANPTGYIIVSNVYVNEEIPLSVDITDRDFPNSGNVLTGNGVTLTAGSFDLVTPQIVGGGTFTTDLGNFTKIEIYAMRFSEFSGEGWTEEGDYARVWTGKASSVSFDGAVIGEDMESIYISYTIAPASAASGIVDNGDGTYTVDYGTELTFVAKPAEGFMLDSWSNGAEVTSDTLKLTMTEELSLTANFKHIPATITLPEGVSIVEPMPAGITSKGEGVYEVEYGTEFQISADSIPAHYHFDHWADLADSVAMYAANPRTIVADENLTIEPSFAIDTYTLTLATNDSTKGVVSLEGAGAGQDEGEGVDIVWDADSWNGIQAYMNGEDIVHVNNSKDGITITFDGGDFENGLKDGKIKLDNSDNKLIFTSTVGKIKKIEIRGYASYKPEGWSRDGGLMWEGTPSDVVELFGQATFVHFVSATFTIEPDATTGKIVDNGDGTYTVDYGTELTFVAKPAEGFMLDSWSNGAEVTSDTLKLTMTEELSLTANFKHIPATITLPEGVNIVEPMPAGITSKGEGVYEVEYGTEFQISADSIPAHYHFDHWADLADSVAMYAANPRTIVAGENLTIEPIFAIDTYTLTLATNDSTMGVVSLEGAGQGGLQEPSAQLIVPESWSSEVGVTITAADLPGFVASTEEAVKALPVPTEGSVFVIYNFKDNGGVEAVTFENGEYVRTTSTPVDHANASYYSNQGMIFLYTTAAGQAGQGGEGEEPEGEPVSVTIGDLTTAQVSDYLPACTMTNYAYSQQIYMANEIGGAGKITAITYWLMNNSNYTRNYEIYMKEVSESAFASNDAWVLLSESDKVASYALANDTDEPVAKTITLNAPFEYSGNGNLMIAIRDITGQWSSGAKGLVNDVNGNKTLYSFRDSKAYDVADPAGTGLLYAKRNVVKIDMIAAPAAAGIVDNGDGTYTVDYGTELTFVAKPAEGFMLDSWSNGAEVTGDTLKLTMTEELSLTANFKYIPAVITLPEGVNIVEPVPAGITALGEGVYEVEHGTEFQISADGAPEHYHFDHWADLSAEDAQYYANPRTVVADTNFTANPFYTIDTYTLTLASNDTTMGKLTIEPADGIVANGDGTYTVDWGTEVTFVAVPAEDYHLLSWSNGAAVTADNKQTLTITDQLSLSAFFKHDTYILTVEGAEVEVAKFADGTNDAAVLNPGTLVGVQAGDSVKLTTTATYSSANVGEDLIITLHYAIEVIDGGIYDNEYALEIEEEEYSLKGAILEPMNPDKDASAEDPESEVEEGLEIQAYGYCHGSEYSIRYHLKSGNPNQYKVEFADARFTDVDWTDLETTGKDGTIDVEIPVDVPTGDYSMTITFRDSRYTWLESAPITVSFHVNLPETYVVALFDDVMAVVDTCECLTDIQWYWRANSTDQWQAIEGATGYYYKQAGGLSGEFFIHAKMNGIDTYTCPQEDLSLYADGKRAKVTAYPNPVQSTTTVTIENSLRYEHDMRIVNLMGSEVLNTTFEGNTTTVEMDAFPHGSYIISVDGVVVNVMKQ